AADAVIVVGEVELRLLGTRLLQCADTLARAVAQVAELAELDRVRRACLCARRLLVVLEAVVAERALPDPAVLLTLVEDPEGTGGHAVAAAVADVLLDDDGVELRPEQRPGGADLEAGGVGAV